MSPAERESFLYHECSFKGLSGISNDMRELQDSTDPRAVFAFTFSSYLVGLIAGMPAVQGIDGFVHRRHRRDFGKNPHGD